MQKHAIGKQEAMPFRNQLYSEDWLYVLVMPVLTAGYPIMRITSAVRWPDSDVERIF